MSNEYKKENRILQALSIRNMKQIELSEKTGIPKNSINGYVKQKWQPKQDAIYKIAKALDVSEMWLAGYDVEMKRPEPQVKIDNLAQVFNIIRKDEELSNLVINLSKLNEGQLQTVKHIVNEFVKANSL